MEDVVLKMQRHVNISHADPFSIEFFEDPFRTHEELREAGPIVWLSRYDIWAVARYSEVRAVLNDWETFCSSRGVGINDFAKDEPWRPKSVILEADPPEHTGARAVLNRILSPGVMRALRDSFSASAEAAVDELVRREFIDGIADLAEAFPLSVFPDALGIPVSGREHLLPYAGINFNAFGPPNELRRKSLEEGTEHIAWVAEQCRRENLAPGGFGMQIYAAADAGDITHAQAESLVRGLLSAGLDTTVNGIGAAVYCLARHADQWQLLRSNPELARPAFEEAIRHESPVQTFFRTATRDVPFGGATIREGDKILMFLGAANRDPRKWDDPSKYDIRRTTVGHVGFGAGVHMCVGQMLARLEGEVMLRALARRIAKLEIVGEVRRRYNNTLRGLASLPLRLVAA